MSTLRLAECSAKLVFATNATRSEGMRTATPIDYESGCADIFNVGNVDKTTNDEVVNIDRTLNTQLGNLDLQNAYLICS
jgi:hypothetical protein